MTKFAQVLCVKGVDLARNGLGLQGIAIERAADALDEAQRRFERESRSMR